MTVDTPSPDLGPATDRLVAHLDHGECYAENYRNEDFGPAVDAVVKAAKAVQKELEIIRRHPDRPTLRVHVDTHRDLAVALDSLDVAIRLVR